MIDQITKGEKDIATYLKTGKKRNSRLTRDEKDDRLVLAGNLDLLESSERHQRETKKQKYNYYHISLSFTTEEWNNLYEKGMVNELIEDYLKFHFPNHDLNELLYYAEAHLPIIHEEPYIPRPEYTKDKKPIKNNIRLNEKHKNGKPLKREPHIHLIVSLENMKFTRPIRTGGLIFSKNKAQMAKSAEKFKRIVNDMLSIKYELNNINPLGKKEQELKVEYEKFKEAAKKVSKGKERKVEMNDEATIPKLDEEPEQKDISVRHLLSDNICSTIDTLLETVETNQELKNDYYARAKKLQELDISEFIQPIQEKYKLNIRLVPGKNKVKIEGLSGYHNITDLMCKGVYNSRKGALFHVVKELENMYINIQAHKNDKKITLSVSDDFKELQGSTKQKPKYQSLTNWKTIEIEQGNIQDVLKHYSAISMAEFDNGKREAKNIKSIIPTLIYDIDNSDFKDGKSDTQFTIKDAISMLEKNKLQGYIYPSASHLLDNKTEKFRLIIPTTQAPSVAEYKEYMKEITKDLGLDGIVDKVGSSPSQMYYTPKVGVEIIEVRGNLLNNEKAIEKAKPIQSSILNGNTQEFNTAKEISNETLENINKTLENTRNHEFKQEPEDSIKLSQYLTRVSFSNLSKEVPIEKLMRYFDETTQIKNEGKYQILHNKDGRHLYIPEENVAYLFKDGKLYTPYTYLKEKMKDAYNSILDGDTEASIIKKLGIKERTKFKTDFERGNVNLYSKVLSEMGDDFKKYANKITKVNYKGLIANIQKCMADWSDEDGIEKLKACYKLQKIEIGYSAIRLGYINVDKLDLHRNGLPYNFGSVSYENTLRKQVIDYKDSALINKKQEKIEKENIYKEKKLSYEQMNQLNTQIKTIISTNYEQLKKYESTGEAYEKLKNERQIINEAKQQIFDRLKESNYDNNAVNEEIEKLRKSVEFLSNNPILPTKKDDLLKLENIFMDYTDNKTSNNSLTYEIFVGSFLKSFERIARVAGMLTELSFVGVANLTIKMLEEVENEIIAIKIEKAIQDSLNLEAQKIHEANQNDLNTALTKHNQMLEEVERMSEEDEIINISIKEFDEKTPLFDLAQHFDPEAEKVKHGDKEIITYNGKQYQYFSEANKMYDCDKKSIVSPYTIFKEYSNNNFKAIRNKAGNASYYISGSIHQDLKNFLKNECLFHYLNYQIQKPNYEKMSNLINNYMKSLDDIEGREKLEKHLKTKISIEISGISAKGHMFDFQKLNIKIPALANKIKQEQEQKRVQQEQNMSINKQKLNTTNSPSFGL